METESKYLKKIRDILLKKIGKAPNSPGPNTKAKYLNDISSALDEWNPGGGGSSSDIFLVNATLDNADLLTLDKSCTEIRAAIDAGKYVIIKADQSVDNDTGDTYYLLDNTGNFYATSTATRRINFFRSDVKITNNVIYIYSIYIDPQYNEEHDNDYAAILYVNNYTAPNEIEIVTLSDIPNDDSHLSSSHAYNSIKNLLDRGKTVVCLGSDKMTTGVHLYTLKSNDTTSSTAAFNNISFVAEPRFVDQVNNGIVEIYQPKVTFRGESPTSTTIDFTKGKVNVSRRGPTYYLHDGIVADNVSTYISCDLDTNMDTGTYIVTLRDTLSNDGLILSSIIEWRGNTITIPFTDIYGTLELTSSTAGLTNYTGDYRKIYCNIIRVI